VRLEGSLDAFSLPDIFSLLSMTKKTGGLHLRRADAHGVVWLGDGLITGGASDLSRLSLGRRLAGSGHVADNHLSAAIDEVARSRDLGIARALRDSRAIDEGELHSVVYEHIVDTVFDLMRWPEGNFEFVVDEANMDDVGVAREVDEVVAESRRRLDIWAAIDDRLSAPATVLSLALDLDADPQLRRDEWALLALVDGRRTVGELVSTCGRGEYSVVVALAELVGRGLVRANDTEGITALLHRQELVASLEAGSPMAVSALRATLAAAPPIDAAAPPIDPAAPPIDPAAPREAPHVAALAEPEPEPVAEPLPEPMVAEAPQRATEPEAQPLFETAVMSAVADLESDGDDDDHDDNDRQVAEISSLPRSTSLTHDIASVIPQRLEPFQPSREPDHPEPLAAAMAGGGMVTAAMPAAAIERDPSVNKSLLLRLIAGVRGL
jgi:hypothetical protein